MLAVGAHSSSQAPHSVGGARCPAGGGRMSVFSSRPALRWLVPAAATVAVIGGGAAIGTFAASAEPSLPPRSAAQLLVDVQTARLEGMSGTVVQRADLGLPTLPKLPPIGGQGGLSLASLISG